MTSSGGLHQVYIVAVRGRTAPLSSRHSHAIQEHSQDIFVSHPYLAKIRRTPSCNPHSGGAVIGHHMSLPSLEACRDIGDPTAAVNI